MAGLLDFFGNGWEDPKSNAVMALAGGLLDGDFASGMKGYSQVMAGAGDAKYKRLMQEAQMENLKSEIEARKLAGTKYADQQALIKSVFGGGVQSNGTGVGEAPYPMGGMSTPNGAVGTPLQEAQSGRSQGGSVLGNMRPDDVARLKLGGLDLTDIYKYANDPQKLEQGSTYKDRNTGLERFMPKVGEGMMPNQQGVYGFAPGYAEAQAKFEGDKASAIERSKNNFNFREVTTPGGGTSLQSNTSLADMVNGQQPQLRSPQAPSLAPRAAAGSEAQIIANGMGGLNGLPMTARGGNVSMKSTPAEMDKPRILQDAFAQVSADFNAAQKAGDSAGMRRAQSYLEEIRGEFARMGGGRAPSLAPSQTNTAPQSAPSFGLQLQSLSEKERTSAENDAYKTKLVEQAKADIQPTQAKQANISAAENAISLVDKALAHPGLSVATGLSGSIDPRNYVPGQVGKDYKAVQSQLEGKAFLSAFEQLKGGGAISEKEGEKAQQAIARMSLSQSEKEYRQGLKDYQEVLRTGLSRMKGEEPKKQESKSANVPAQPMRGAVISGYRFKGGDPANQANWEKQ